jgi:hypothetical protein
VRCDDLARALSAAGDDEPLQGRARRHVESCLRCQAELVQYRKLIRVLHALRTEVLAPGAGFAADILEGLEEAGERSALRSLLAGRRPLPLALPYVVVATAAAGAGVAVAARGCPRGVRTRRWRGAGGPGGLSWRHTRRGQ